MGLQGAGRVLRVVAGRGREEWDAFVNGHPYGHLLQSWGWGELKASMGWSPVRLGLYEGERMVAGAQVLRRTALRVPLWAGHLAYIPKGPVVDWGQRDVCEAFFEALHGYMRKTGALALRIEPGLEVGTPVGGVVQEYLAALPVQPVHPIQPLRTIVVDLAADEETLLGQMKEKWRYNVRLAGRKGVTVRVGSSSEDVRAWYRLYQTTAERDHFGIHAFEYYQRVWRLFSANDEVVLLLAEHDGQLLAGICVGLFAGQAIYLYGASGNEGRQLMPNYLLQWEAMRWAKGRGALCYDLWGIPDTDTEDEAMAGVYRFKRGWGGRVVEFVGAYEWVYRPLAMQVARRWLE